MVESHEKGWDSTVQDAEGGRTDGDREGDVMADHIIRVLGHQEAVREAEALRGDVPPTLLPISDVGPDLSLSVKALEIHRRAACAAPCVDAPIGGMPIPRIALALHVGTRIVSRCADRSTMRSP